MGPPKGSWMASLLPGEECPDLKKVRLNFRQRPRTESRAIPKNCKAS